MKRAAVRLSFARPNADGKSCRCRGCCIILKFPAFSGAIRFPGNRFFSAVLLPGAVLL